MIWTKDCTDNELWRFEVDETDKPNVIASVEPTNGNLYAIQHATAGGFIGAEKTKGHIPRFETKVDECEQFIFEDHLGVFGLRQKVSGLYLGVSDKVGEPLGLTDKYMLNEKFQLVSKDKGAFAIKNHNGLWLTKQGDFIGWSQDCGSNELWKFVPL